MRGAIVITARTAEIASAAASGDMSHREIADIFGVSRARVAAIAKAHGLVRKPGRRRNTRAMKPIADFFDAKVAWSIATFGPGDRAAGLIAHIDDEIHREIAANPADIGEWIDVILLAMDGAARCAGADGTEFARALVERHERNTRRRWPPPGSVPADEPTNHIEEP